MPMRSVSDASQLSDPRNFGKADVNNAPLIHFLRHFDVKSIACKLYSKFDVAVDAICTGS